MNCQTFTELFHGYLDRELDLIQSLEAEQHLKACPACAKRYQEQLALRQVISNKAEYFQATPEFRERLRNAMPQASRTRSSPMGRTSRNWDFSSLLLRWLAPAALAGLALFLAMVWVANPSTEHRLAGEIVSAHLRSLMGNHLTDVASTDQHTVKPWFNGKLAFSPPVADPAAQGFPLLGGRLDVVGEQPVAALVYQRRQHLINLFIWPSVRSGSSREKVLTQRGYNLVHWRASGMDYWAASDVSLDELRNFAHLVAAAVSAK